MLAIGMVVTDALALQCGVYNVDHTAASSPLADCQDPWPADNGADYHREGRTHEDMMP